MTEQRVVALFGDSLLMDTVEASLADNHDLGVIRIHNTVASAAERLASLGPDLIILDLNDLHSDMMVTLLRDQPHIPLLCVDITSSKVVALSCQHYTVLTVNDLAEVIELQTGGKNGSSNHSRMALGHLWEEIPVLVGV